MNKLIYRSKNKIKSRFDKNHQKTKEEKRKRREREVKDTSVQELLKC